MTSKNESCGHPKLYVRDMFNQQTPWGSCLICERDELSQRLDSWYTAEAAIRGALMELVGDDVYLKAIDKAQVARAAHNPRLAAETRDEHAKDR